jgi:hypothetical protein
LETYSRRKVQFLAFSKYRGNSLCLKTMQYRIKTHSAITLHVKQQEDTIRNLMLLGEMLIMGNKQL